MQLEGRKEAVGSGHPVGDVSSGSLLQTPAVLSQQRDETMSTFGFITIFETYVRNKSKISFSKSQLGKALKHLNVHKCFVEVSSLDPVYFLSHKHINLSLKSC